MEQTYEQRVIDMKSHAHTHTHKHAHRQRQRQTKTIEHNKCTSGHLDCTTRDLFFCSVVVNVIVVALLQHDIIFDIIKRHKDQRNLHMHTTQFAHGVQIEKEHPHICT